MKVLISATAILFDFSKFDTNFCGPNWTISKTMLDKQTSKQNKWLFSPLVRDNWQLTQSITTQPSIKLWIQLLAPIPMEKHFPVVNWGKSGWVMEDRLLDRHRRQKENSKDKPVSYYVLQVIKSIKQKKSAQGIVYFYSGQ